MRCPYCNHDLKYNDWYYRGNYAAYQNGNPYSGFEKLGDIYVCPNREGFDDIQPGVKVEFNDPNGKSWVGEVIDLIDTPDRTLFKIESFGQFFELTEDDFCTIPCESAQFNGFFYTDKQENLKEGHPC